MADRTTSVLETRMPDQADNSAAFPLLTDEQIAFLAGFATKRVFTDGEALWEVGDTNASFFVILSGAVAISQLTTDGGKDPVVSHGAGGFTGDIDLLSQYASVVEGRATGETATLEICPATLQKLVVTNSAISDVILQAFLERRRILLAGGVGSVLLIGSRYSPDAFRIREFLERNSRPFTWVDLETDDRTESLLNKFDIKPEETPVVVGPDGQLYRNPSIQEMAACIGLSTLRGEEVCDVIVVGAGPAGLAASVYAGSEGLNVLTIDSIAPGGQASTSSKIENYLGFHTGISGRELAQRAFVQAEKFGVHVAVPRRAVSLNCDAVPFEVVVDNGEIIRGRTVVIASGAEYRKIGVDGAAQKEGRGIYFGATAMEAQLCRDANVIVVGGGNSAGQAAVYLSQVARQVDILIRSESLDHSMSRYLISRIEHTPNITLHPHTEVTGLEGEDSLSGVMTTCNKTGANRHFDTPFLFVFIGARPNTQWLNDCVVTDEKGFIKTGLDLSPEELDPARWVGTRRPFLLETSVPGVFAAGDVRSGSVKRVASSVGEGSICVPFIHQVIERGLQ